MRPALERLHQIEQHLLSQPTAAGQAQWQLQLLTDPELATDTDAQQQLYAALREAGRQQLRRELNAIHARLERTNRRHGWLQAAAHQLRQLLGR